MFNKKDFIFSVVTGLTAGVIAWRVLVFLGVSLPFGVSSSTLVFVIPILWILGVWLGYFLGHWIVAFNQFGKFAAVGFTNFVVDAGVLNLLIYFSEINTGIGYSIFKAISFFVASIHSYGWNKFWVFEAGGQGHEGQTFAKFMGVAVAAIIVNVLAASIIVALGPKFGLTGDQWANIGGIVGSAVALIFSFFGYKIAVFKK